MKVTIIGTGYVGLVSGAVFADWGHEVVCLDIDAKKVENIKKGIMPIYEEGLEELVDKVQNKDKRFEVTTDYKGAVEHGEVIFICVGTPGNQSGAADLSYVDQAAQSIGKNIPEGDYKVVVTKSTVPVGTHNRVKENVKKGSEGKKISFDVASCPEFLREGTSIYDANNSERTVIGSNSEKALDILSGVYATLKSPIVRTDVASAELIKYAANAFLATKISFINEMSQICERTGADVVSVAKGMGLDSRIGPKFLNAGIGYGGSCFPKDVEALYRTSSENFYDFRLLRGVMDANERQKDYFFDKITSKYGANLYGLTFGVLGAAFKNGTDNTRKSVAIQIIRMLRGHGAKMKVYDPAAMDNAKRELGNEYITYVDSSDEVFKDSDALVILTEWKEFAELDYKTLLPQLKEKVVFDGRNLLDPIKMQEMDVDYYAIGRFLGK